jgi:hypothetical protein
VKKTVAIHPIINAYIKRTWALLIESGYDATYSTALNFMLLRAIFEALRERGWSERTRRLVWSFMEDEETVNELNIEDHLANIGEKISVSREAIIEIREKVRVKEKSVKLQLQKE